VSRPQHSKAVRLRLAPAVLGIGAVMAVAGCSAGQVTETDTQVAAVNGANGETQQAFVRDAQLTFPEGKPFYPAGSAAPMQVVLVNESGAADRLVQVTSPYAASVQLGGMTQLPSRTTLRATGEPAEGPENPAVEGQPTDQRKIKITLKGMTRDIRPGVTIPVTFSFEKAGQVTVQVPIAADKAPRSEHGSAH
jgi:copper(I)-binding protein